MTWMYGDLVVSSADRRGMSSDQIEAMGASSASSMARADGQASRMARAMLVARVTGSLSCRSSDNHTTGRSAASTQLWSSVDLPYPAGAMMVTTEASNGSGLRPSRRSRATTGRRTVGGCNLVAAEGDAIVVNASRAIRHPEMSGRQWEP